MPISVEDIAHTLRHARESKGLTQRALSEKVGLPQSHISKIEAGRVDLQTSSLMEIARALDLDLVLVPRAALPAVQALSPPPEQIQWQIEELISRDIDRLIGRIERQRAKHPEQDFLPPISDALAALRRIRIPPSAADRVEVLLVQLDGTLKRLERLRLMAQPARRIREIRPQLLKLTNKLRHARNELAHGIINAPKERQPAYQLDEEGSDNG